MRMQVSSDIQEVISTFENIVGHLFQLINEKSWKNGKYLDILGNELDFFNFLLTKAFYLWFFLWKVYILSIQWKYFVKRNQD